MSYTLDHLRPDYTDHDDHKIQLLADCTNHNRRLVHSNYGLDNLQQMSYESAAKDIEQEKKMVAALKRLSIGNMMNYDPDLPNEEMEFQFLFQDSRFDDNARKDKSPPSSSSSRSPSPSPSKGGSRLSQSYVHSSRPLSIREDSDKSDDEEVLDADSLLWVPANLHPEVAPESFKDHVKTTVEEIMERQLSRKNSLKRKTSLSTSISRSDSAKENRSPSKSPVKDSKSVSPLKTPKTESPPDISPEKLSSPPNKTPESHLSPTRDSDPKTPSRFSNPSLKELSSELEKLSKLAGRNSTDAVTVARTLSASSLGYTDVEKLAFDELNASPRSSQSSLDDIYDPLSPTSVKTYEENLFPYETDQTANDIINVLNQEFSLRRSRRVDYRKQSLSNSMSAGAKLQQSKAKRISSLRNDLLDPQPQINGTTPLPQVISPTPTIVVPAIDTDHTLIPQSNSSQLRSKQSKGYTSQEAPIQYPTHQKRSSQHLFSYRNPNDSAGSLTKENPYGNATPSSPLDEKMHPTKYTQHNLTAKRLSHIKVQPGGPQVKTRSSSHSHANQHQGYQYKNEQKVRQHQRNVIPSGSSQSSLDSTERRMRHNQGPSVQPSAYVQKTQSGSMPNQPHGYHAQSLSQYPMHPQQAHPQQAHPQQAHPQQAHPQQAHPQQAHPQQAHPQQAHPQQTYPQQAYPQQTYPQQAHPQQGNAQHKHRHKYDPNYQMKAQMRQASTQKQPQVNHHVKHKGSWQLRQMNPQMKNQMNSQMGHQMNSQMNTQMNTLMQQQMMQQQQMIQHQHTQHQQIQMQLYKVKNHGPSPRHQNQDRTPGQHRTRGQHANHGKYTQDSGKYRQMSDVNHNPQPNLKIEIPKDSQFPAQDQIQPQVVTPEKSQFETSIPANNENDSARTVHYSKNEDDTVLRQSPGKKTVQNLVSENNLQPSQAQHMSADDQITTSESNESKSNRKGGLGRSLSQEAVIKSQKLNQNLDLLRNEINEFKESLNREKQEIPKPVIINDSPDLKENPDVDFSFEQSYQDLSFEDKLGIVENSEDESEGDLNLGSPLIRNDMTGFIANTNDRQLETSFDGDSTVSDTLTAKEEHHSFNNTEPIVDQPKVTEKGVVFHKRIGHAVMTSQSNQELELVPEPEMRLEEENVTEDLESTKNKELVESVTPKTINDIMAKEVDEIDSHEISDQSSFDSSPIDEQFDLKNKSSASLVSGESYSSASINSPKTSPHKVKKKKSWPWMRVHDKEKRERSVSSSTAELSSISEDLVKGTRSVSSPETFHRVEEDKMEEKRNNTSQESKQVKEVKENMISKFFKRKRSNSVSVIEEKNESDYESDVESKLSIKSGGIFKKKGKKEDKKMGMKILKSTSSNSLHDHITKEEDHNKIEDKKIEVEVEDKTVSIDDNRKKEKREKSEPKEKKDKKAKRDKKVKKKEPEEQEQVEQEGVEAEQPAETANETEDKDVEKTLQTTQEVQEKIKKSIRRTSKANQPIEFTDSAFGFPLPPPSQSTLIMLDYRFPVHVERAIYRLSHLKLANPKRSLREQVLLSNFMYAYLNLVDHTLHLEQQMNEDSINEDIGNIDPIDENNEALEQMDIDNEIVA